MHEQRRALCCAGALTGWDRVLYNGGEDGCGVSAVATGRTIVRRGGIYPARGACGGAGFPGRKNPAPTNEGKRHHIPAMLAANLTLEFPNNRRACRNLNGQQIQPKPPMEARVFYAASLPFSASQDFGRRRAVPGRCVGGGRPFLLRRRIPCACALAVACRRVGSGAAGGAAAAGLCLAAALFWLNAPAYTVDAAARSLRRQFPASTVQFAGCVTATPRRPLIRYDVYCFFIGDRYGYFEPDSGQYIEMGAKDVWQTA